MPLDYTNSIPLYVQLKEKIEGKIMDGTYSGKVPSERELMDEFYISRSTVRHAIDALVREGSLVKKPGKGTFVAVKPINDWLGILSSTTETIQNMNMRPGAKLIKSRTLTLPAYLQKITGLTEAVHIKRIRFADNIPIGIENNYYPVQLGEKIIQYDLNKATLYDLLEKELGIMSIEAAQTIRADQVKKTDAKLLKVPSNTSTLIAERKLVDMRGDFIEYEHAAYRSDMYSFNIKLSRKK
ncbi:GntR family transcriptional regulator [Salinicoccus roseus]|uniref:GntR family transcriptional regulator n=1 Tax=Salinicoccus roseus TaxID=45670 RepID=UPI000F4DF6A4|nr:GntR family transcriptional regulator [Salinicoccus roseus]RPE54756.1 GntR family transcriptional regulator [Salinicoccus roseus]GGA62889.1 GntR family transcriptional regulator [Salinicoccus roseus]